MKSDKDISLYLEHRDKINTDDETKLTVYFMKTIYRRIWWIILLTIIASIGLFELLEPAIGTIPADIIVVFIFTFSEYKLIRTFA